MIKQISFADVKQHNQSNGVKLVFLLSVLFFLTYSSLRAPSCSISAWSVEFQRHIAQVIRQHLYRRITVRETVSSAHRALTIEQQSSTSSEPEYTITSVPMQSVVLPCKAVLPHIEPERVMWYKLINPGLPSTLSVGKHLITKDSRFSVAYYSVDHGFSPAKWDLHITHIRSSDAAHYQCHVVTKDNRKSTRSNVQLIVEDIIVDIQPIDVLVSIGDTTQFSCNFTGEHRVRREKITWLKDGKPLTADATRVTTSTELPNVTVTTLQIIVSNFNDSGSYRCSDGHGAQSKEAKLYLRDANQEIFLRSLSSSTSISILLSFRTVFYSFIFHFCLL